MLLRAVVSILYCLSAHALLRLKPLNGRVEDVFVDQIPTVHGRVQRSAGGNCLFPHLLRFKFEVQTEEVVLNLQKNELVRTNVPVFVMKDGQIQQKELENNNFELYQDMNRGSAMVVSCEDGDTFNLHGSFYHNGDMYHISPSNLTERWQNHFIQRQKASSDRYLNDAVIPPLNFIKENQNEEQPARERREVGTENIVELLITADASIYEYFLEDQGTDAAAEIAIHQYMALLTNEIDLHYISIGMNDASLSIRVYFSGVIIAKSAADATWSTLSQASSTSIVDGVTVTQTYLDDSLILNNLNLWRQNQQNLPQHDHMMAMSMIDLADLSGSSPDVNVEGIAYVGTVCQSSGMVSFTEVDGSRVSLVAAHELGHGLDSWHDGDTGIASTCSPSDKNIMTPFFSATTSLAYAEAQWTFSQCSIDAFKSFINSLSSNCMQEHAFSNGAVTNEQLPGKIYSLDQQCQMYKGHSSSSCQSTISENECYSGFRCSGENACSGSYDPLYPLAGTSCGSPSDDKWCYRGQCVARTVIATTTTSTDSSSTSTTSATTSTSSTISTSSTTSTTSTTPSTTTTSSPTTSTSSTTSSTQSTTTSTTPPTTTTLSPTTSTSTSTSSTQSSTTSTTPTTTTTSQSTTSTSSSPSSTITSTSTSSSTTSMTTPTTTTSCTQKKCCKRFRWPWRKYCCQGRHCCQNSWAVDTECYSNCCSDNTTPVTTQSPYCQKKCCRFIGRGIHRRLVCCRGNDCCNISWGSNLKCCRYCQNNSGNNTTTTTTTTTTSTTTEACYNGKCCARIRKGWRIKTVCCKGKKCCRYSWASESICCRTCR